MGSLQQENEPVTEAVVSSSECMDASVVVNQDVEQPSEQQQQEPGLDKEAELIRACQEGDVDLLKELLAEDKAACSTCNSSSWTLLHIACYYGQLDVVSVLVDLGAEVNACNRLGETPLHLAAKWPHDKVVEVLCHAGADVNARNKRGRSPVHNAAAFNRRAILELMLSQQGCDLNAVDAVGETPLHLAVRMHLTAHGDDEAVRLLLRAGADPEATDAAGRTPVDLLAKPGELLRFAVLENSTRLAQSLLVRCTGTGGGAAAPPAQQANQLQLLLDGRDKDGYTLLHHAVKHNSADMVRLLIKAGARPSISRAAGPTPPSAHLAAGLPAPLDHNPLQLAAECAGVDVVSALLEGGAKLGSTYMGGLTALHGAVWYGQEEVVKLLLAAKMDPNARIRSNGMTPLHYAVYTVRARPGVVSALLHAGARTEERTAEGCPVLCLAAQWAPVEVVDVLLQRGARLQAKAKGGRTAIEYASDRPDVLDIMAAAATKAGWKDTAAEAAAAAAKARQRLRALQREQQQQDKVLRRLLGPSAAGLLALPPAGGSSSSAGGAGAADAGAGTSGSSSDDRASSSKGAGSSGSRESIIASLRKVTDKVPQLLHASGAKARTTTSMDPSAGLSLSRGDFTACFCSLRPGPVFGSEGGADGAKPDAVDAAPGGCARCRVDPGTGMIRVSDSFVMLTCTAGCAAGFHVPCWKAARDLLRARRPGFTGIFSSQLTEAVPCTVQPPGQCSGVVECIELMPAWLPGDKCPAKRMLYALPAHLRPLHSAGAKRAALPAGAASPAAGPSTSSSASSSGDVAITEISPATVKDGGVSKSISWRATVSIKSRASASGSGTASTSVSASAGTSTSGRQLDPPHHHRLELAASTAPERLEDSMMLNIATLATTLSAKRQSRKHGSGSGSSSGMQWDAGAAAAAAAAHAAAPAGADADSSSVIGGVAEGVRQSVADVLALVRPISEAVAGSIVKASASQPRPVPRKPSVQQHAATNPWLKQQQQQPTQQRQQGAGGSSGGAQKPRLRHHRTSSLPAASSSAADAAAAVNAAAQADGSSTAVDSADVAASGAIEPGAGAYQFDTTAAGSSNNSSSSATATSQPCATAAATQAAASSAADPASSRSNSSSSGADGCAAVFGGRTQEQQNPPAASDAAAAPEPALGPASRPEAAALPQLSAVHADQRAAAAPAAADAPAATAAGQSPGTVEAGASSSGSSDADVPARAAVLLPAQAEEPAPAVSVSLQQLERPEHAAAGVHGGADHRDSECEQPAAAPPAPAAASTEVVAPPVPLPAARSPAAAAPADAAGAPEPAAPLAVAAPPAAPSQAAPVPAAPAPAAAAAAAAPAEAPAAASGGAEALDIVGQALQELKQQGTDAASSSSGGGSHLLLECPDIRLLSKTPGMVEVWMREHVGKHGQLLAWRVLGPYGALAVSLSSGQEAATARAALNGNLMLLSPLLVSELADFPEDTMLAACAQKVATQNRPDRSWMADMVTCWQRLQELPASVHTPPASS